jgi:HD-GYP domain-containing protein (c-di-GMP phosphodiesterase class II)
MSKDVRIRLYVCLIIACAAGSVAAVSSFRLPFPGWWPIATLVFVASLLESLNTQLRLAATGTTSFIIHMAAALLFGGWWAAGVVAVSTLLGQLIISNPPIKVVFNVAQRTLSICVAALCYQGLGGQLPPAYLVSGEVLASAAVQRDIALFFLFSTVYFIVNATAVNGAVVLSSGRSFREAWNLNTRGVLAYDLTASVIALMVAWLYTRFETWVGFGSLGLIGVIVPIVAVRHVYGLYHRLEDSGQELLQVMVKAIEARDPYTSGHSLRVSELSRAIAVELGLSAREIEQVETAALLHDVGKIYEEFAPLLRKESRLTPEETALMQTHSTKSAELVGIISKFRGFIQDSVRHHHERWDGQGYPTGLGGKAIPLAARIILISDTIDAMTTDRPYRKRLGLDVVIAELQKCKGTQFDPELVEVTVSSVAVRRLIAGNSSTSLEDTGPTRSKRVSWPGTAALWKVGKI